MRLYERHYKSNYEELITYYPRYYRDVFEMVEILKAFGRAADGLEENIEQAYLNNFILTADAETIKVWEGILDITYTEKLTLDQRKRVVIARLNGGHIGEPEIRWIISNYTDNAVRMDFGRGIVTIVIEGEVFDEENLYKTLLRRIPAHLALGMTIEVRRVFRRTLKISFGGATGANFWPPPVSEDRTSRLRIPVGYGGAAGAQFKTAPVGEDRTARTDYEVGYGARAFTSFHPEPVGEDRTATTPLDVAYGGLLKPGVTGIPPEPQRAATGRTEGAGGMFYHTHTKSKLMG